MASRILNLVLIYLLVSTPVAIAETIYINQTAEGADNGTYQNAHSITWFNTLGNWASPKVVGKLGPSDTALFTNTFTTAAIGKLTFTLGNEITWKFAENAKFSFVESSGGILYPLSYTIIDGGVNGILENTGNGTLLSTQKVSLGIVVSGVSNVEIKNLTFNNFYVHTPSVADSTNQFNSGGPIYGNGSRGNLVIHNNTFSQGCWMINLQQNIGTNWQIYSNSFEYYDHGVAGVMSFPGSDMSYLYVHHNVFGHTYNWDTGSANAYHHDGIHVYGAPNSVLKNYYLTNNLFYGEWGTNNTAHAYHEGDFTFANLGAISNAVISGNVFIEGSTKLNNGFSGQIGTNWGWYNNTFIGNPALSGNLGVSITGSAKFTNNVFYGMNSVLNLTTTNTFNSDNNAYIGYIGTGGNLPFHRNGVNYSTLSAFIAASGSDSHSFTNGPITISTNGTPQTGSVLISAGADIKTIVPVDFYDQTWNTLMDIGAVKFGSSTSGGYLVGKPIITGKSIFR